MKERYDVVIIGGSIAGVSAALTCVNRGKTVAVIANGEETSNLYKAEKITNYPGVPNASGKEISEILRRQLAESGAELIDGRALNIVPLGESF
ncbi:MAG: NAD(P)/FAD-dependent oxidoreductase, partial [Oscillibacter sp.]|nr:NAD(P)/FAD-dependent oxidoreductase [Oscillibacter sp.]